MMVPRRVSLLKDMGPASMEKGDTATPSKPTWVFLVEQNDLPVLVTFACYQMVIVESMNLLIIP